MIHISKLKVLSLFSGIGAFEKALVNKKIPYDLINFSEIDKYAVQSYCAIHNVDESLNLGDITKVDESTIPNFDLMFYGFPCQSYSLAGKKLGTDDPRGVLFYDALKVVREKKPKYAIAENVKNLTGTNFRDVFEDMLKELDFVGYNNYWTILNTRNFGIPQNRERVFIVSIRKDIRQDFEFPVGAETTAILKEVLENNVDDNYYITDERQVEKINDTAHFGKNYVQYDLSGKGYKSQDQRAYYEDGYHGTLPSKGGSSKCKVILESDAELPILHNIYGGFKEKKPRIFNDYSPTIRTSSGGGHIPSVCTKDNDKVEKEISGYVIRKLTPKECWRLQGFDDKDIDKCISIGISNTQLYKQAGNSITVKVLEEIFKNMLNEYISV